MGKYIDDAEIDKIYEDAEDAAINAWGPLGASTFKSCPYPDTSKEALIWNNAFRSAYAHHNGY